MKNTRRLNIFVLYNKILTKIIINYNLQIDKNTKAYINGFNILRTMN